MKITINYTMTAPVSHIGETSSTEAYFQQIQTADGKIPVITANSIRGQMRDSAALYLLDSIRCNTDIEVFNVLFSGGNISGTMKNDVERAKAIREHFPMVSLFGGGVGTMLLSGKMQVGFAYPVCKETRKITGIRSDVSWHDLMGEIEFTRTDDSKNDQNSIHIDGEIPTEKAKGKASTQMRYAVEYMAPGTEYMQTVIFHGNITNLELGAFYSALLKWFEVPKLGGMSAKGFGMFDAKVGEDITLQLGEIHVSEKIASLVSAYKEFAISEGNTNFSLLKEGKSNGKKSDDAS